MKWDKWEELTLAQEMSVHALAGSGTWTIDYRGRDGTVIVFFYEPYEHFLVQPSGRAFPWDSNSKSIGNPGADRALAEK